MKRQGAQLRAGILARLANFGGSLRWTIADDLQVALGQFAAIGAMLKG